MIAIKTGSALFYKITVELEENPINQCTLTYTKFLLAYHF